jgi:hypothetical protein
MKLSHSIIISAAGLVVLGCISAWAQTSPTAVPSTTGINANGPESAGAPGAPDAATTIDGRYLPLRAVVQAAAWTVRH